VADETSARLMLSGSRLARGWLAQIREERADVCLTGQCSDVRLPRTDVDAARRCSRRVL